MSDTPRTDTVAACYNDGHMYAPDADVPASFARIMERALAEASAANNDLSQIAAKFMAERDQWREVAEGLYRKLSSILPRPIVPLHGIEDGAMQAFRRLKEASK